MPLAVVGGIPSKMLAELGSLHGPQSGRAVLSEALQKRRGRFHRRTHHICERLRGAVDTPRVLPWGANRLAAQSGTQMLQSAFDIGDRHNAITLGL